MKPNGSRKWMGVVAAGVVLAALFAWSRRDTGAHVTAQAAPPAPLAVRTIAIAPRSVSKTLEATGVVRAYMDVPVATKVQGRVLEVLVREGDAVRRGQPLVRLDARDLDAAVAQAEANRRAASVGVDSAVTAAAMERSVADARVAQAEAGMRNAEAAVQAARARLELVRNGPRPQERRQASLAVAQARSALTLADNDLKRMRSLHAQGAISRQQLDIAESRYETTLASHDAALQGESMAEEGSRHEDVRAASEAVRQAEAGLNEARAGLQEARAAVMQVAVRRQQIRGAKAQEGQSKAAVAMARVTRDYATIHAPFDGVITGRLVDPGALASPGVPLLTMQGGALRLDAVVPENALGDIRVGAPVPVRLDALLSRSLEGRVVEVAPRGDDASHTFVVKIELPSGSGARAGMFGRAAFAAGQGRGLFVPGESVVRREGLDYVYVNEGGVARLRLVTLGEGGPNGQAVLSGLNAGERIVRSARGVNDGQPITEADGGA